MMKTTRGIFDPALEGIMNYDVDVDTYDEMFSMFEDELEKDVDLSRPSQCTSMGLC